MSMTKPQMRERIDWLTKRNALLEQIVERKTKEVVDEWQSRLVTLDLKTSQEADVEAVMRYQELVFKHGKYEDEDDYSCILNWLAGCLDLALKDFVKEQRSAVNLGKEGENE